MSWEAFAALVAAAALGLQTVALVAAGARQRSKTEASIRAEMNKNRIEDGEKLSAAVHHVGETFNAFRQKLSEIELYLRDNYVRRDSFQAVNAQIMTDIKDIGDRIETRLLRMENKIDRRNGS